MRHLYGAGTPKGLQALAATLAASSQTLLAHRGAFAAAVRHACNLRRRLLVQPIAFARRAGAWVPKPTFATAC
jgi:hypothetical protein